MKVKEIVRLIPNGTVLFIQTNVCHVDAEPPFEEMCEETFKVGSCKQIPSADKEVRMIGAIYTQEMHIQTEPMYV